jgi:hypothetical protein
VRYADDIIVGFEHEADARRFWDAMRERLQEFSLSLNSEPGRVWSPCGAQTRPARARKAGDLQVLGVHPHLRSISTGQVPPQTENPA